MAAAVMWIFATLPRRPSKRCAAVAGNACVATVAVLAAALALTVVVEHPEAFAIAHEALAQEVQPGLLGNAGDETGLLVAQRAAARRAPRSQAPLQPHAGAGTDCARVEATPTTAPVPASPARELGDYPVMPVAATDAVATTG
jgi:hypothetical protein